MTQRAHFHVDTTGRYVTLTADNEIGERRSTTYFISAGEGLRYVRIWDDEGRYPQVCEMLSNRGNTLMATPATLAKVIRHEHRAAQAWLRRWGG